jgi:DNA replication protein DnaC
MSALRARVHHLVSGSSEFSKIEGPQVATPETSSFTPAPCMTCHGSGMEVVPGKGARRCSCRLEQQQSQLLEQSRIPRRYENCTLANYCPAPNNETQLQAFNFAFKLVSRFPAVDQGLLFMGPVGVGKTHLATAILRGLIARGTPCLFCEFGTLLGEIRDSYNSISQSSALKVLAPVYEAEVLVLDELGALKPTEWVQVTVLTPPFESYAGSYTQFLSSSFLQHLPIGDLPVALGWVEEQAAHNLNYYLRRIVDDIMLLGIRLEAQ